MIMAMAILLIAALASVVRATNLNRKGATQEVQIVEGCVNDNGTALTADGQTWTVTDPWVLTGHEDQEVRAKVSENGETKKIDVLRVLSGVPQYWAHWDYSEDSGYRK